MVRDERDAKNNALERVSQESMAKSNALVQVRSESEAKTAALRRVQEEATAKTKALSRAESERLAAESANLLRTDPGRALLFAIAALERSENHRSRTAALAALGALREERTILGHGVEVTGSAFLAEGRRIVTAALDFTVRVWDVATGQEMFRLSDLRGGATGVAVHPDGTQFACASWDGTARVWKSADGRPVHVFRHGAQPVNDLAFAPAGDTFLATAGHEGTVKLWHDSRDPPRVLKGHRGPVVDLEYSPNGEFLASAGVDGTARIWAVTNAAQLAELNGHTAAIRAVAFHANGELVATASADGTARIWTVQGEPIATLSGHERAVSCVVFSTSGELCVTSCEGGEARVWQATSGAPIAHFKEHTGPILTLSFQPGTDVVLTTSEDRTARIWEARSGLQLDVLRGHEGSVSAAGWSKDGKQVVTGSKDDTARIWRPQLISPERPRWPRWARFSPDYAYVALPTPAGRVELREATTGRLKRQYGSPGAPTRKVFFDADGERLAATNSKGEAQIWDALSGELLTTLRGHRAVIGDLTFTNDGRRVVTGSDDGTARVWDASTGATLQILTGHAPPVSAIAFDGQRNVVATVSAIDMTATLWNPETGEKLTRLRHPTGWLYFASLEPRGDLLLTASKMNVLFAWRIGTDKPPIELFGFESDLTRVVFKAGEAPTVDERLLTTLHVDGTAHLWRLQMESGTSERLLTVQDQPGERFVDGRLLPSHIETISSSGESRLWPLDPLEIARKRKPRTPTSGDLRALATGSQEDRERASVAETYLDLMRCVTAARHLEQAGGAGSPTYRGLGLQIERLVRYFAKPRIRAIAEKLGRHKDGDSFVALETTALGVLERAVRAPGIDDKTARALRQEIDSLRSRLSPALPTLHTADAALANRGVVATQQSLGESTPKLRVRCHRKKICRCTSSPTRRTARQSRGTL